MTERPRETPAKPGPDDAWGQVAVALQHRKGSDSKPGPDCDHGPGGRSGPPAAAAERRAWAFRRRRFAVVAVAAVVIAGVAIGLTRSGGLRGDAALAVNGHQVTKAQLATNISVLAKFYGITAPAPTDRPAYATFLKTAAKAYAIDLVLGEAALAQKVVVTPQEVNAEFDQLVKTTAGGDRAKLDQTLAGDGLTESDLRDQIGRQLLELRLYNRVGGQVNVTAAQLDQAYAGNAAALATPESRSISHIVVADQSTAQAIMAQLGHGASFATLAGESLDTTTKASGGALGTLTKVQLASAFAQAAFSAEVNVPFGPINEGSGGGWDIGMVTAITRAQPAVDNTRTRTVLRSYLTQQIQNRRWSMWLSGQLVRAHVRYAPAYRPAHPAADPPPPQATLSELMAAQP